MKTIIAATVLFAACATTGRSLPSTESSVGIQPRFDSEVVQSNEAKSWFPELASEASLPSAARFQRELSTTRDRFQLGVRVCVAPDGSVAKVDVNLPSGADVLDRSASKDIQSWRYQPFTAPAHIRVCQQMQLDYEPAAEQSYRALRLVRTSQP